ncbi:hypothetical protein [Planctomyces sp. SH-PL62]|uniref:hypothetical protein n=1 Tax=Planctomyces sp. SH-PL62 TaxID=1636152 RepID=UPI00078D880C|nr:hypothetical protein [Planctomyces sp. SH-PL62]AMV37373.1 hypothetical protein VT85_08060 [Planctomyces sp. SH-PL62]
MPGSFDFDPYDVPLSGPAATIRVCRYEPDAQGEARYAVLPNVTCERIRHAEGPEPPTAWFRYVLDDADPAAVAPADFGRLWPLEAAGPYVVRNDERLVVLATTPDGEARVLFDGFAQAPQVDLTPQSQRVSFIALGVASRCWDEPIGGRLQRHADDPFHGEAVAVHLPSRFNPDGKPNCTPDGFDVEQADASVRYPVFFDPDVDRRPDPRSYWTLGKFVRYILGVYNDESYVFNPDFDRLDALLQSRGPAPDASPIGGAGGTAADVVIRDYDATNVPWPEALADQLGLAGFGLRFLTGEDGDGSPRSEIEVYRKDADAAGPVRDLLLPGPGADLNPARCNVSTLHLRRDSRAIVNAVTVETAQRRVELSVVLAPGFQPVAGDESASRRAKFLRANLAASDGEDARKYRLYVADEAGDGHWHAPSSSWSTAALDLSEVFRDDEKGASTYVKRLRPGSSTLITRDEQGRPMRAQLAVSRDYAGRSPAVWDGTGHWQPISGGWQLLEDRLGIYVAVEDPESWAIGDYTGDHPQEPSRTLRGVTSQANPSSPNTRFHLRLTAVVEDDLMLPASVDARPASPTAFTRRCRVDARDHFALETVAARSLHNPEAEPKTVRDDTPRAVAWARQLRAAHELPPTVGGATVPSLVTAYRVGDRIARINGRDVGLQTNVGEAQGETPVYPIVTAVVWDFTDDRQATVIELSDAEVDHAS